MIALLEPTTAAAPAGDDQDLFLRHFEEMVVATTAFGDKRKVGEIQVMFRGKALSEDKVTDSLVKLIPAKLSNQISTARSRLSRVLERYCIPADDRHHYAEPLKRLFGRRRRITREDQRRQAYQAQHLWQLGRGRKPLPRLRRDPRSRGGRSRRPDHGLSQ